MPNNQISLHIAKPSDAKQLLAIYSHYVEKTAISFEYTVPTVGEFEMRIKNTLAKYPYIIAKLGSEILGYAYSSAFSPRAAYDWSAEVTIYLKETQQKTGLGKLLYDKLEKIAKAQNILNLNACIACTDTEDEHLTNNSVQFHEHLGYKIVGRFHKCGYKFFKWYDMVWMEKIIGKHCPNPAPVIPFPKLNLEKLQIF